MSEARRATPCDRLRPAAAALVRGALSLPKRRRLAALLLVGAAFLLAGAAFLKRVSIDAALTATVTRGALSLRLTETGILKPAESITYRSPVAGRETEIVFLVAEGTRVNEGDLLVRLDTTELQHEVERAVQDLRQAQLDRQVAEVERQQGLQTLDSLAEGEGSLGLDETRAQLRLAEKKVERLRQSYESLKPLMEKGFMTREELDKSAFELEQAEAELALARRKAEVFIGKRHPQEQQRARLQLAQKQSQAENAKTRVREAEAHVKVLRRTLESCNLYARAPGLVVYEEFLGAGARRKVRVGDRVTGSQGIVTIPEVQRMIVEASVREADVHRVSAGQPASVRVDAFPGLRLTGRVARVGTLARAGAGGSLEDKRFDLVVEIDPADAELRPEMTARVDVLIGEKKDVLLLPVNAVFDRQGLTVCHLLHAFRVETRQVELGDMGDTVVEVRRGLAAGDRVALTDVAGGTVTQASGGADKPAMLKALKPEPAALGPR